MASKVVGPPPVLSSGAEIYSGAALDRFSSLVKRFEETYGEKPTYVARAPGRVNLIGEHVDYSGYAVLPMAIEQDFIIAAAPSSKDTLEVANVNEKFSSRSMAAWPVEIDDSKHDWINYFLAGYRGLLEHAKVEKPVGLRCMVDGNVPPGSGLSSSSAFVVCAALTAVYGNGLSYAKDELATVCAKAEHYVGTEGGGMDQSISCLAEQGTAKLIEFNPIRATDVPLPEGGVFVISNSCVEANKYVTAGSCYNKRVVECRAAALLLAKALGLPDHASFRRLGQVQEKAGLSLEQMGDVVAKHLHEGDYSQDEMAAALDLSKEALQKEVLSPSTIDQEGFSLRLRAQHVFKEASLVFAFKEAKTLPELGELMNKSHASCRDLYECSCPELDTLTQLCRDNGAYGSRLTGAGWGGCAVSLVPADIVPTFLQKIRELYYNTPELAAKVDDNLFATKPARGAAVVKLQ